MSVTIGAYVRAGARSDDGVVRLAKGHEGQLVNKGTLGNSAASFFRSIGEALHLVQPDPTRAQRQQDALQGFQRAMREHFGEGIANAALAQQHLLDPGARLTGSAIQGATRIAMAQIQANRQANVQAMRDFLPPAPGQQPSQAFTDLAARLNPPRAADSFSAAERSAIAERLQLAVGGASRLGREQIAPQDLQALARSVVKQVARLSEPGQLDAANAARRDLASNMRGLVADLSSGAAPDRVADRMRQVNDALSPAVQTNGLEGSGDEVADLLRDATLVALRGMSGRAQEKTLASILGPESPLRAVLSAAADRREDMSDLGQRSQQLLTRMNAIGTMVASTLGLSVGAATGSRATDVQRVVDPDGLDARVLTRGSDGLERALARMQPDPTVGQLFLSRLLDDFAGVNEEAGGAPNWHDVRVLERLDGFVTDRSGGPGQPRGNAIDEMRREIGRSTTLPDGLKHKLSAALDAMAEEDWLHAKLQGIPQFAGVPKADLWRLFAGAELQGLGVAEGGDAPRIVSKWQLEQKGEGSLAGMMRGFGMMLDGLAEGTPLTAQHLEALHRESTKDSFTDELLQLSYKEAPSDDPDEVAAFKEIAEETRRDARVKPGFRDRNDDVVLTLRRGEESTPEGEEALLLVAQEDRGWFRHAEVRVGTGAVGLELQRKTPEEAEARATAILDAYREGIAGAGTEDEKLEVIGRTAQALYRSHVFSDGNTRTVLFNALNRMLLENGLAPAVLPEPRAAAGFTLDQFVAAIREGQQRFQALVP